jgi:hypothetical protein
MSFSRPSGTHRTTHGLLPERKFASIEVKRENMLAMARKGYCCSTELANDLCRSFDLDYRTAHDVVNHFVVESAKRGIPSREASLEVFQEAARAILDRELEIEEARLRELLDPVHFVKVTTSRGGVSPQEVSRMITARRKALEEARARQLKRIETLEAGRELLLSDLRKLQAKVAPSERADGEAANHLQRRTSDPREIQMTDCGFDGDGTQMRFAPRDGQIPSCQHRRAASLDIGVPSLFIRERSSRKYLTHFERLLVLEDS